MKNRILALLLAGLITASMVACTDTKSRDKGPGTGGTEQVQTKDPNGNQNGGPTITVTWQDVNEQVYVISDKLTLTPVNDGTSITASQMDKLTRVKVGSNGQSIVEVSGVQYTALSKSLSNEDLTGEFYEAVSPAQTMYVTTDGLNIRTYASANETFSKKVGDGLKLNDTVKVVAKGTKWYKIEHTDGKTYFVSAQYLSSTVVKDVNDLSNYPTITDYPEGERKTMYVIASQSVNVRQAPNASADLVKDEDNVLLRDAEVKVYADITIDGSNWSKVVYQGKTGVNVVGFVNSRYLSVNKGGVAQVTLDDILKDYDDFSRLEQPQTLYTMDSLNVRSTPEVINGDNHNKIAGYAKKGETVKVVATGTNKGTFWALVEYEEGKFGFASYAYLTTDASGNPAPASLAQLLAANPNFTEVTTQKTVYAKDNTISCLTAPQWEDTETKLSDGQAVTVVATAEINYQTWYIYKTADGLYFFGVDNWFSESAS